MRVGLIAMSGLRANNPELTRMGYTLPGFVERSNVIASLPSLGLLTLAGMVPEQWDIEYVEVPDISRLTSLPGEFDVVAISSLSAQIRDAYALADRYRSAGRKVVLGGLHVTACAEEAVSHADSVALGEGEVSWPAILVDFERNDLQPVYDCRSVSFNLAQSPMPRFDLLEIGRYNRLTVQTQRGCPFACEFCGSSIRLTPHFKMKPIAKVIAEIRRIKELWPHPFVEFADDNTFANKRHGRELLRALAGEHVRWFTETDLSIADDDELLELMRDSGCAQVLIGFESPSHRGLDGLELKANWKAAQRDRYLRAIERIQAHGITVNGCFILGLDGTGTESFDEVRKFVQKSGLFEVQITVLTPFPGTPLYDRLKREDRLLHQKAWELCTLMDVNFRPTGMTPSELERGFMGLAESLYSDEAKRARRESFFAGLRRSRDTVHHHTEGSMTQ
jgi:radical SAM superfamily enzyme YgiQ (UPF0313 family)